MTVKVALCMALPARAQAERSSSAPFSAVRVATKQPLAGRCKNTSSGVGGEGGGVGVWGERDWQHVAVCSNATERRDGSLKPETASSLTMTPEQISPSSLRSHSRGCNGSVFISRICVLELGKF